ncbi:MAG: UvrD-helicase domain-containing protein [Acidimicrobiales bacterium]
MAERSSASGLVGLPDAEARRVVTGALSRTLFVEAGAGSGKTTALVARVVNMVASGIPIGRIAAITFTEAAARELRVRVRDELERIGIEQQDRLLATAAGQVETAAITTLHGFALRVLGDHPVEAGLPPGFGVADEITSMLDFDESWRLFTGQVGDDLDLLDVQERAAVLGVELRRFQDIARRFDDNWDLLDLVDRAPPPLSVIDLTEELDRIESLGALVDHCLDDADLLASALIELAGSVDDARRLDPLTQIEWLEQLKWPNRRGGRKGNWIRLDIDDARKEVEAARSAAEDATNRYRVEVIASFVAKVAAFVEDRVQDRQAQGELSFHDLLVLARKLLRSNESVREELHQRYTHILLDEFQDTDPLQIELAVLVAAEGTVGNRPWQELAAELGAGRLVVVGDPKQSIYRFRRADIAVYRDAEEVLVTAPERLTSNFRSVPGVVEWANEFFGDVIGDGVPGAQPAYIALEPVRSGDPTAEVPVHAVGGPHDRSVSVGEIRQLEAADVAAVICRALDEGWRTERDGQWRPLRLQDIAVLIPSRLSLPALEAAFGAANIPFRPETSSLVYATQEVRDVIAGVRAVVEPSSSVDVVAALRSGLFAVGDDELLAWHLADNPWDYTALRPATQVPDTGVAGLAGDVDGGAIAEAFETLLDWHRNRFWTEPSALIDTIVRERRLREAALAEPRPRDRWRRYRFLAEQAREFTATHGGDLGDFVAWVEIQSSDLARVTEPIPAEPDDDAVRVLTVHGSKGLEFPMVVLAGAPTREMNRLGGTQVLFPGDAAPEVKLAKGKSTQLFDIQASVEEVLDRHERVRLHYVAATRARDLLVVSAHHKEGMQSSGLRTWEGLQATTGLWRPFEKRGDERYRVEPPTQLRLDSSDHPAVEAAWLNEHDRLLSVTRSSREVSATGIAAELTDVAPDVSRSSGSRRDVDHELGETARRGRAGTAFGVAVHATLQQIDLLDPVGVAELARFNADREGIGDRAAEVADHVKVALSAPVIDLARRHRHWRELYLSATVGETLLEGFVDLCIDGPDGLLIVDYKTDLVTSTADIDAKLDRYRHQAAAYALALEAVTGRDVVDCRFVFIGPSGVVERDLADLDGDRSRLMAYLLGGAPPAEPIVNSYDDV